MSFVSKFDTMENIILHATPLQDLRDLIGDVVAEKLQELRTGEPSPNTSNDVYLTRKETCHLLRISFSTLHQYTKEGYLQSYRIGGRKLYRADEVYENVLPVQSIKYKRRAEQ